MPTKLISLSEAAKLLGLTASSLRKYRTLGRQNLEGDRVHLQCWKTSSGWATTADAILEFQDAINCGPVPR